MNIGDRVRLLREKKGMTQEELATQLGYKSKSSVTHIERGRDIPRSMVVKLADILNTTPAYLMGWDEIEETLDFIDTITGPEHTSSQVKERDAKIRAKISSLKNSYIEENQEKKSEITNDELQRIKKYRKLDRYGKEAVDSVLNVEYNRCTSIVEDDDEDQEIKIKHSYYKVSAGTGFNLGNDDEWETISIPDTPEARKADFALTIKGNSMEPVYFDGDIVLVKEQSAIDVGQIGIFIVEGNGYIKKYGGDRLISLNAEYDDILFKNYDSDSIRCAGRVIGRV